MKIVVSSCNTKSLATFRLDMMLYFIKKGHKVYALGDSFDKYWVGYFSKHDIEYISIGCNRNGTNIKEDIRYFKSLKKTLNIIQPDLIFSYQLKSNLYSGLAKPNNVKLMTLFAGLGTVFMTNSFPNRIIRKLIHIPMKFSLSRSDYILFHNKDNMNHMIRQNLVKKDKAYVVNGSGVNIEKFDYNEIPRDKINFLYLGRVLEDKGILEFLEASKRIKKDYPDVSFSIVGNFDTNPTSLKLDRIQEYSQYVDYYGETSNPFYYFKRSTVFVYPSYHEGLPKAVIEAMSVGRPVITTDAPGCRDTVVQGTNGYLVPPKNVDALELVMRKFVKMDWNEINHMGLISRKIAEEKFSSDIINEKIYSIIVREGN